MMRRRPGLSRVPPDIRYALQQVRWHPALAAVVILSLAIGIGANTAIFSVVNAVMLRDLPVQDPAHLLVFQYAEPGGQWPSALDHSHSGRAGRDAAGRPVSLSVSWPSFTYMQSRARLSTLAGFVPLGMVDRSSAVVRGEPMLVDADMVTAGCFPLLGVRPALGRGIVNEDERPDAARVGVISDRFWNRAYARSRSALGDTIVLNGVPVTLVGVAPPSFEGLEVGRSPDIWIQMGPQTGLTPWGTPSKAAPEVVYAAADYWWLPVIVRLKPGVSADQARTELERLFHESLRSTAAGTAVPADKLPQVALTSASSGLNTMSRRLSTPLAILTAVVGLVLLVACANVATLLLARATSRRREMAVRLALGAPRSRLVRQLMAESFVYAAAGAILGGLFALWGGRVLLVLLQQGRDASALDVRMDPAVLGFTALVSLATTMLFGLAPALSATRLDLGSDLKENSPTARGTGRGRRLLGGKAMVAAQVALSLPLVLGAGLFLRTLHNLERQQLGFDPEDLLLFRLDATKAGLKGERLLAAYGDIRDRVAVLPGVRGVTASRLGLITGWVSNGPIAVEDERLNLDRRARNIHWNMVAPGFFQTMGMRLVLGRAVDERDEPGSPKVAVVNEALARRFFPGQNPIGRRFWFGRTREGNGVEIVGVVADARYSNLRDPAPPTAFLPYTQDRYPLSAVFFEVRAAGDQAALVAGITRIVREVVPGVPLDQVKMQAQQIAESLGPETMYARLFTLFGLVALVLACVGLYGTMSFALGRRTREIGIRMALGAAGGRVLRASLAEALGVAVAGIAAGALLAWAGGRYVRSLLFEMTPLDGATVAGAVLVMLAVTLAAAYLPARRASRLNPLRALREE